MKDPEYLEIIPAFPAPGYTMRAETIRKWLKAIIFFAVILFVGYVMLWGTP